MFEQDAWQKPFLRKAGVALFCGFVIWLVALIHGAAIVRDAPIGFHYIVQIGPFNLNELAKLPLIQGYTIRLDFRGGIFWYYLCSFVVGLIIEFLWRKKSISDS